MNLIKFIYKLAAAAAMFSFALPAAAQITFDSSFECGNGTNFALTAPNTYSFRQETDTNSTDRQWFYFTVSGAKGQALTFRLTNTDSNNVPSHWNTARPVVSGDGGQTWTHVTGATAHVSSVFSFTHTPTSDTEHVAFHFPYTLTHALEQIDAWAAHPDVTRTVIGQSVQGRDIVRLRVSQDAVSPPGGKRGAWIVARQHAAEVTGSWMLEGFMEFLLSGDPKAVALREWFEINVVPVCNPDGVVAGNYRDNFAGVNLNRVWNNPSAVSSPEILAVTQAIAAWVPGAPSYDFFADLHSTSSAFPHFAFYASSSIEPPLYFDPPNYYEHSVAFLALMNANNAAFDNTQGASASTDMSLSRQHQTFEYGVLAILFEGGYNRVNFGPDSSSYMTPAVHQGMGEALARSLFDYFSLPLGLPATMWMTN